MANASITTIDSILKSILGLFYPSICPGCSKILMNGEDMICVNCLFDLPFTDIHNKINNQVEERLAGKIPFDAATALCFYQKSSTIQSLIQALKYRGNTDIGLYLGEMLGRSLSYSNRFNDIDYIIPVPLHPMKLRMRGYNQSDFIGEGVSVALNASVSNENLVRSKHTQTQTTKSIFDRWKNVSQIFECLDPDQFANKHVLVVDDVITSGSTLEGCISALTVIPGIKISVALIACAE
ncbi:MAG: ComF family protein [Patiriisocius sp.]|jgi:ComF family protein